MELSEPFNTTVIPGIPTFGMGFANFEPVKASKCELQSQECFGQAYVCHFWLQHPTTDDYKEWMNAPVEHDLSSEDKSYWLAFCRFHRENWFIQQFSEWFRYQDEVRRQRFNDE